MSVKRPIFSVVFAIFLYVPHPAVADVVTASSSACSGKKLGQKCKIDYSNAFIGRGRKSVKGRCHSDAELEGKKHKSGDDVFLGLGRDRYSFRLRCMTKKDVRETKKRLREWRKRQRAETKRNQEAFKKRMRENEAAIATEQPDVGEKTDMRSDYPQQEIEPTIEVREIDEPEFVPQPIEEGLRAEDSSDVMAWGASALSAFIGGILLIAIRRSGRRFEKS